MSTDYQILFTTSPSAVRGEFGQPQVPQAEVETRLSELRRKVLDDTRQQYEAQINDLRGEAVEFHQQVLDQVEKALTAWQKEWVEQVPQLIFAGVKAVLADFSLGDEQLHGWVRRTLDEAGANDQSELEVRLSSHNVQRLEAFWESNDIAVPGKCRLHAIESYHDLECRVVGKRGIFDASLPVRLEQLKRLWNLAE